MLCASGYALCSSALCFYAEAQQPAKIPRIGFLAGESLLTANPDPLSDAFRQGLQERGYIDGKNIMIEYRYAEGRSDRLPGLVAEFVQLKVDVIVVAQYPGDPRGQAGDKDDSHRDRDY